MVYLFVGRSELGGGGFVGLVLIAAIIALGGVGDKVENNLRDGLSCEQMDRPIALVLDLYGQVPPPSAFDHAHSKEQAKAGERGLVMDEANKVSWHGEVFERTCQGELNRLKRRAIYGADVHDFMPNENVILTEAPFFIWARGGTSGKYSNIKVADNNSHLVVKHVGFLAEERHPFSEKPVPYYDLDLLNPETDLTFAAKGMTFDMYVNHLQPALEEALGSIRKFADQLARLDRELEKRFARGGIEDNKRLSITEAQARKFFTPRQYDWLYEASLKNPKYLTNSLDFTTDEQTFSPVKGSWSSLRGLAWARDYFGFRSKFAVLLYEHASTAHKAQGSTYKHVFVDWPNLETIRDHEDRQAACYVAVSRASDTLHIRI